ncbi:DUF1993 domain-containing protein [Aspergillus lucknowensis]|uniref:DUF1993 domain-containing protein n=1 Tax=Aspergillus lucknowensis TaxID=176173 RepID=A0ABR4L8X6_9EURO
MASPYHSYAITSAIKALKTQKAILQKGEEHAKQKGAPLDDLFNARLYEDMWPLSLQVWAATSNALKLYYLAAHVEVPNFEQSDKTYEDLYKRIDETLAILEKADTATLAANEGKTFKAPMGPSELEFTPEGYAVRFGLGNFFFHIVTAYNILRKEGVNLTKWDYLKNFMGM